MPALAYFSLWLYFTVINPTKPPDVFHGVKPDLGIPFKEEVVTDFTQSKFIGKTPYYVRVGKTKFLRNKTASWDFYICWISKLYPTEKWGDTYYPYFGRRIPAKDVPEELWDKEIEEIIKFDEENRVVEFDLGFTNLTTILPSPD